MRKNEKKKRKDTQIPQQHTSGQLSDSIKQKNGGKDGRKET